MNVVLMFDYHRCVDTESKHVGNKPQYPKPQITKTAKTFQVKVAGRYSGEADSLLCLEYRVQLLFSPL